MVSTSNSASSFRRNAHPTSNPKNYVIKFALSGLERSYVFSTVSYLHRSCEKFTRLLIRQVITVQYLDVDRSQNA
jgi:hypothetical protein